MRNFDESHITAAVLDRFKNAPAPCSAQTGGSLPQHFLASVREVLLTRRSAKNPGGI